MQNKQTITQNVVVVLTANEAAELLLQVAGE
jgi:hypothetical protein